MGQITWIEFAEESGGSGDEVSQWQGSEGRLTAAPSHTIWTTTTSDPGAQRLGTKFYVSVIM